MDERYLKPTFEGGQRHTFYSFADLNQAGSCQVKDFVVLHQSFIQSSKNYYNHILESMLLLLPSMSSDLLLTIFHEIAIKCMFSDGISSELKVYLLKFADKILHICKGSILINHSFLTNVVRAMLPTQASPGSKKKQDNLSSRQDEMVGKLCQTIWQTLKNDLFGNSSIKGYRVVLSWVLQQLNSLAELAAPAQQFTSSCMQQMKPAENQRLLVVLDLIEHLLEQNQQPRQSQVRALQKVQLRDPCTRGTPVEDSLNDSHQSQFQNSHVHLQSNFQTHAQKQRYQVLALQHSVLVTPMVFWFNYAVESKERLPYFKIIWRILITLLDSLPTHKVKTDCICIVLPVLQRIDSFCQTSSPSQEMLQFLRIVMTDLKTNVLPKAHKASKASFFTFLEAFMLNFTKVIPHNLHDEVFQVCELIYELLSSQGRISQDHVGHIVDALLHKYTMRSKAHKTLCQTFIKNWVLDHSCLQLSQAKVLKSEEQPILAQETEPEGVELSAGVGSHESAKLKLSFDTFFDLCLFDNEPIRTKSSLSQVDQDFIYFEKLSMVLDLAISLQKEHAALFQRLLGRSDFGDAIMRVYLYPRSQENAVRILEALTSFFIKNLSHHNVYEHPLVQQMPPRLYMDVRPAAQMQAHSLMQYRLHNLNSEPSLLFQFINQEDDPVDNEYRLDQEPADLEDFQPNQASQPNQPNRVLNHHYSHDFGLIQTPLANPQPVPLADERSSRPVSNQNMMLHDEISILTRERFVLIKVHASLIRHSIDEVGKDVAQLLQPSQSATTRDTSSSLNVLNLLHNFFANLCPVPTFQNIVIREIVQHTSPINPAQIYQMPGRNANQNSMGGSSQGNSYMRAPLHHFPQMQQSDIIPEFESMSLPYPPFDHVHPQQNGFSADVECWDLRYIHARTAFLIKAFHFVEQTATQSSWSSVRALCYSVLANAVKIFEVSKLRTHFQKQLKQLLTPLLHRLLQSKSIEGKAGGLNILGNLCGLASFKSSEPRLSFGKNRLRTVYDSDNGREYDYEKYALIQREAEIRDQIKASENLHVFRKNTQFVSLAIWQEVFKLQDDWDVSIREAASILVQLCAPPDSVKHFNKMKREQYSLQLNQMLNQQRAGSEPFSINKNASTTDGISQATSFVHDQQSYQQPGISYYSNAPRQNFMANTFQSSMQFHDINHFIDDLDGQANLLEECKNSQDEADDSDDPFEIQLIEEEQLQSALRIFENGFKPLKSLFATTDCDQFKTKQNCGTIFEGNQEPNIIDLFEDNMLEEVDSSGILELKDPVDFFFEIKKREKAMAAAPQVDAEDLGIIDLDQQGADDFEELDDDKLPVLKNTYSKKNRPNNSKSVAIGSRSQGGSIKHRTITAEHEQPLLAQVNEANDLISEEEDDVFIEEVEGSDYTSQEDVQYLKQRNTRKDLRSANSDSRNAKKKQTGRLDDRASAISDKVLKKANSVHEAQADRLDEASEKQVVDSDALRSQLDLQTLKQSDKEAFSQSERRVKESLDNLRRIDLDQVLINTRQHQAKGENAIVTKKARNEIDAQSHQGNLKHTTRLLNEMDGLSDLHKTDLPSESPSSSLRIDSQQIDQSISCASSQFKKSSSPSLPSQISLENALESRQKKFGIESVKAKKQPSQPKAKQKIGIQISKEKVLKKITPVDKARADFTVKTSTSFVSQQYNILKSVNKRQLSQNQKQPTPQFITKSISIGHQILKPKLPETQSREGSKLRQSLQRPNEPKKDLLTKNVTEKEYYRFEEQKRVVKPSHSEVSDTYSATKGVRIDSKRQRKGSFSSDGALEYFGREKLPNSAEKRKSQTKMRADGFAIDLGPMEARQGKIPKSSRNSQSKDGLQVSSTVTLDKRAMRPQRPQGPTVGGKHNQTQKEDESRGNRKTRTRIQVVADEELDREISDCSFEKA